jgi:hypothetical protein
LVSSARPKDASFKFPKVYRIKRNRYKFKEVFIAVPLHFFACLCSAFALPLPCLCPAFALPKKKSERFLNK